MKSAEERERGKKDGVTAKYSTSLKERKRDDRSSVRVLLVSPKDCLTPLVQNLWHPHSYCHTVHHHRRRPAIPSSPFHQSTPLWLTYRIYDFALSRLLLELFTIWIEHLKTYLNILLRFRYINSLWVISNHNHHLPQQQKHIRSKNIPGILLSFQREENILASRKIWFESNPIFAITWHNHLLHGPFRSPIVDLAALESTGKNKPKKKKRSPADLSIHKKKSLTSSSPFGLSTSATIFLQ